jgi:hypothetical protein
MEARPERYGTNAFCLDFNKIHASVCDPIAGEHRYCLSTLDRLEEGNH